MAGSLSMNKAAILAKIETTYGVDPVPAGGSNAILISDVTLNPMEMKTEDRANIRPFFGNNEQLPTGLHAKLSFTCELAGAGAPGDVPAWAPLILACGFAETVTVDEKVEYSPVSENFKSVTQYYNLDGVLHKLTGARGSVALDLTKDARPKLKFSFTGLFNEVTDAVVSGIDYSAWVKPLPVNRTNTPELTLHGYGSATHSLSIDLANNVVYRELMNSPQSVKITDRKPKGSILMEAVRVADKDWWTAIKDVDTGLLHVQHGTTAGNIVEVDCPNTQIITPQYQNQDGVAMLQGGLVFVPGATGNDEIKITVR